MPYGDSPHAPYCALEQPIPGPACTCLLGATYRAVQAAKPTVVTLPPRDINDLVGGLRRLADQLEQGKFAGAENLGWVLTGPNGIAIGMFGPNANRFHIAGHFQAAAQKALGNLPEL